MYFKHVVCPFSSLFTKSFLCLKVISEIKSTCTSMTEEELAKLAVQLLNCQSEAEDRETYPCTPEMVRMNIENCEGKWTFKKFILVPPIIEDLH